MKRIKSILICGSALALTGLTTLLVAASGDRDAKAIVRSVHGDVKYQLPGGQFMPLKVNAVLDPQTVLKSTAGAEAYLQVNGTTSTVKLEESTTVTLSKMENLGAGDSSTDLKLDGGKLLGKVKKLSANSDYKVAVPNGVAGIRGTDFQVSVTWDATGNNYTIVFTSVTGTIVCQVNFPIVTGGQDTRTLIDGQSWTVTGSVTGGTLVINQPQTLPADVYAAILRAFDGFPPPPPPPGGGNPPPPGTYVPPGTSGTYTGGDSGASGGSPPPPPPGDSVRVR
jgi:hypothetical protein